jgi:hypothetical protein
MLAARSCRDDAKRRPRKAVDRYARVLAPDHERT